MQQPVQVCRRTRIGNILRKSSTSTVSPPTAFVCARSVTTSRSPPKLRKQPSFPLGRSPFSAMAPSRAQQHSSTTVPKADTIRMLVLETDEAHPDTHKEQGSFGQVLDKLFKAAGDNHDPPLGVETVMRFVVEDKEHREGSVPALEELEDIHAVLLTGSMYDAHGDEEWILKLLALLKEIWTKRPDIKLSGVCFGHQLICRMLGSTVESTPGSRWELAHTTMKLSRTGRALFPSQAEKGTLDLHQMHSDHVVDAPNAETSKGLLKPDQKVHVWASTETTDVQGIYIRERAFTTQGHLGFDEDMVKRQIEMRKESGAIEDERVARQGKDKAAEEHDGEIVAAAILRFFHGDDCDVD